jgi:hypothetical protein
VAVDDTGTLRPDWARALTERHLRTRRAAPDEIGHPDWGERIRRLVAMLDPGRQPIALAALVVAPSA